MTEDEITAFLTGLDGVVVTVAGPDNGAPEVAWGDSFFFYYDPAVGGPTDLPVDRRFPFVTIVVNDYPGFDEASQLSRPAVFRVNVNAGRTLFEEMLGYPPAEASQHSDGIDFSVLDTLIPHPLYATQGWVSILNPHRIDVKALLRNGYERARARARAGDRQR